MLFFRCHFCRLAWKMAVLSCSGDRGVCRKVRGGTPCGKGIAASTRSTARRRLEAGPSSPPRRGPQPGPTEMCIVACGGWQNPCRHRQPISAARKPLLCSENPRLDATMFPARSGISRFLSFRNCRCLIGDTHPSVWNDCCRGVSVYSGRLEAGHVARR